MFSYGIDGVGFKCDTACLKTANNAYIDNTAFNNETNFVGPIFSAGTPIRDRTIQSPPSNANSNHRHLMQIIME